jgi:hypothetical protein
LLPFVTCGDRQFKCDDKHDLLFSSILKVGNYKCNKNLILNIGINFLANSKSSEKLKKNMPIFATFVVNVFLTLDTTLIDKKPAE